MIARAFSWSIDDLVSVTGGRPTGRLSGRSVASVATDSREVEPGALFVALSGTRFDGNDFLQEAVRRGAVALLAAPSMGVRGLLRLEDAVLVEVPDPLRALGDLARAHRSRLGCVVYALTGSNGKTTTKEMLASILAVRSRVLKTEGNLNNLIGVPMTLLGLGPGHERAVVEMGMNQPGEIARLTEITGPDVGLVLNVASAHIGPLGSLQAVAAAKGELYRGLDASRSLAVVNLDDALACREAQVLGLRARTFGASAAADVRLLESVSIHGGRQRVSLGVDGQTICFDLGLPGRHNALNAAAAVAAATALPARLAGDRASSGAVTGDDIVAGLEAVGTVPGRLSFRPLGRRTIVDDAYNANEASVIAAVETVARLAHDEHRGFIALIGEMLELGGFSEESHRQVGRALGREGARLVLAFGHEAAPVAESATAAGVEAHWEPADVDAAWSWLKPRLQDDDFVLVKGSRGARMERFMDRMQRELV